jgi:hypothetical protein
MYSVDIMEGRVEDAGHMQSLEYGRPDFWRCMKTVEDLNLQCLEVVEILQCAGR